MPVLQRLITVTFWGLLFTFLLPFLNCCCGNHKPEIGIGIFHSLLADPTISSITGLFWLLGYLAIPVALLWHQRHRKPLFIALLTLFGFLCFTTVLGSLLLRRATSEDILYGFWLTLVLYGLNTFFTLFRWWQRQLEER